MKRRIIAAILALTLILSLLPASVFAANEILPTDCVITVDSTYAMAGDEIKVNVGIKNNPGILGATLRITWDEGLTMTSATNGSAFSMLTFTKPSNTTRGGDFVWYGEALTDDQIKDGNILSITFAVSEEAVVDEAIPINISFSAGDIFDNDLQYIAPVVVSGEVLILNYKPGDANGDKRINAMDLVFLCRYIADGCKTDPNGYNVTLEERAGDVNDDGRINAMDLVLICRYIADGGATVPEGYNIILKPATPKCVHELVKTDGKAAECEKAGNIAYWQCSKCDKYYKDAAALTEIKLADTVIPALEHEGMVVPGYPADYGKEGLTDGLKCSVCGKTLKAQEPIEALVPSEYAITYKLSGSDAYLQSLEKSGKIANTNPDRYTKQKGLAKLYDLTVPGYEFKGWYDNNGTRYTSIPVGTEGELELIARWEKVVYTITYDSPDFDIIIEKDGVKYTNEQKYTVDTAVALPTPEIPKYIFVGWSNDDGFIMPRVLPAGTSGNMTLHANWTSERNKTTSYKNYGAPIIIADEDAMQITFVYDIGKIENVPLRAYEGDMSYFEITSSDNPIEINRQFEMTETYSDEQMESVADAVANATTRSSGWTLSKEWNELYSEGTEDQRGQVKSEERTDTQGNVVGGKYFVSNSEGGSSYVSTESGSSSSTSAKVTTENSYGTNYSYDQSTEMYADTKLSATNETEVSAKVSASYGVAKAEAGVKNTTTIGAETSNGRKDNEAVHFDGQTSSYIGTDNSSSSSSYYNVATNKSTSWNSETGYEQSNSITNESSVLNAIADEVRKTSKYSFEKSLSGTNTEHEIVEGQEINEKTYSTSVRYNHGTGEKKTYSVKGTYSMPGHYRWVEAGTVHVYGVVGYDIATGSYYTRTYSVLADETKPYQDFSRTTSAFDDCENGVVTFDIPYEVNEYVLALTAATDGIEVDYAGRVNDFDPKPIKPAGEEAKDDDIQKYWDTTIVLPQYYSIDNGDGTASAVAVKSIDPAIFADETVKQNLTTVVLPSYVTEIPAGTFKDCVNLKKVIGFGITSIGAEAFSGCTSLETFYVDNLIESVGEGAFDGVNAIKVMANNPEVAEAAIKSGAKSISLDLTKMSGDFDNRKITVNEGTEYFALIGGGKPFTNLQIESNATETFLSNMTLTGNENTPLTTTSTKLTLARVTIGNTPGYAMKLLAENTAVYLQGTVSVATKGEYAVIGRSVSFAKANSGVTGILSLTGSYAIYGVRTGDAMVSFADAKYGWVEIEDLDAYETMLETVSITYDANDGVFADGTNKLIKSYQYESAYGEFPAPTRIGYTFKGWFTEMTGGVRVTEENNANATVTLHAQWDAMAYTATWNGGVGYTMTVNRTASPYAGAAVGELVNGSPVYYGDVLKITYTIQTGYAFSKTGATDITVEKNVTADMIYATTTVNSYVLTIPTHKGYTATVERTSSPLQGASLGLLSSGSAIYYGDVLKVTYAAKTGYTLKSHGEASITVTGNVGSDKIYGSPAVNQYTISWNVVSYGIHTVKRTSSPLQGASTGTLSNGAAIYYGDVITVAYGAATGYSVSEHGATSITVTRNIIWSDIYMTVAANSYTYTIVYKSSNGTALGTSSASYKYGTTNTISAPAKSGYTTPSSQSIKWDSTSAKTITFTYIPTAVATTQGLASGWWWQSNGNYGITFDAKGEYRNRTANSVEIRVNWTQSIKGAAFGYNQYFYCSMWTNGVNRGNTGNVKIASSSTWPYYSSNGPWHTASVNASSGWVKVTLTTTDATSVMVGCDWWTDGTNASGSWTNKYISIPAY